MSNDLSSSQQDQLFRDRLRKLRHEAHYSYKQLEELTGISRSTLQRYETSSSSNIKLNRLSALAKVYNVPVSYLMGYEDKELSFENLSCISNILEELDYHLEYNELFESYCIIHGHDTFKISNEQLTDLKNSTYSFLEFKLHKLFATTTE